MKLLCPNDGGRRKPGSLGGEDRSSPVILRRSAASSAFTLLEVIVASAIFFMVGFAILELVTRSLAAARSLQERSPDAGLLAAMATPSLQLTEGTASGDFEDLYPGLYPGYSWLAETNEVGSNGLFQVDFVIYSNGAKKRGNSEEKMSILMFRPGSKPGSASKGRL